jgi:hypothetical protein
MRQDKDLRACIVTHMIRKLKVILPVHYKYKYLSITSTNTLTTKSKYECMG